MTLNEVELGKRIKKNIYFSFDHISSDRNNGVISMTNTSMNTMWVDGFSFMHTTEETNISIVSETSRSQI